MNDLYTVVVDYSGGLYIGQSQANSPQEAILKWAENFDIRQIKEMNENIKNEMISELNLSLKSRLVNLESLINAWCISFVANDKLGIVNVILTCPQQNKKDHAV